MINFREDKHMYWVEIEGAKQIVPSVSTIIGNILDLDNQYKNIDPFYANRGTAVHKAIELLIAKNLDEESLDEEALPETAGFFFGSNADDHYAEADREFIVAARAAIKQGYTVVYSSWW